MEGSRELDGSFQPSASVAWRDGRDDVDLDGAEARVDGILALGSFPKGEAVAVAAAVRGISAVLWAENSVDRCDNDAVTNGGSVGDDNCSGSESSAADC